ncbi:potassium-transporting ATPase subunit C [Candidatus Bathyarchaeota archaeon]|nr:potassium-transporting ATPase subunit C [Candidatus Bathyarchaeota archaeon]
MVSVVKEIRKNSSPAIRLAIISILLCGLLFPLVITGLAQVAFSSQANGSLAHSSTGKDIGSYLIAQNFSLPIFFHPRNSSISASGVDPDITRDDARAQVPTVSSAIGISQNDLNALIDQNLEGTFWIFGSPYVNVLRLNIALIQDFPSVYCPQYCQ